MESLVKHMTLSHVRSIAVFGRSIEILSVVKSRYLRILDLEGCYLLSDHCLGGLQNLFELKYLSLKNTSLRVLPEHMGELKNLETLDLEGTWITELPVKIVQLQRLVHLLIDRNVELPDGIGNMKAMEELKIINLFDHSSRIGLENSHLTNMRNLSIYWGARIRSPGSYLRKRKREHTLYDVPIFDEPTWNNVFSSLCKLVNLRYLSIDIDRECEDYTLSWHPTHKLQKLVIKGSS